MPRIVVVGSANTDLVIHLDRLPAPGETVTDGRFFSAAGGKGANQAVAARRLGAEVTFIARLGDDAHGDAAVAGYRREGLNLDWVGREPRTASGVALILVESGGENQIAVAPGANGTLTPQHLRAAAAAFAGAVVVLLQLESPLATVQAAAELGRAHGATVILNPAPMPVGGLPPELLAVVDVLTPNQTEAAVLGEIADLAALRSSLGVELLVVTCGKDGAWIASADGVERVAAPTVEAVDAVGAGDAFNAALAVALASGRPVAEAARHGCCAGALAATREGAQPSLPTGAELARFLAQR